MFFSKLGKAIGKFLIWLIVTALLLVGALYGVMYILTNGPSPTARKLFVRSVRETSAVYWLADLYCTKEEIAEIEASGVEEEMDVTDTSLVSVNAVEASSEDGPHVDEWGFVDDDGDGLILETVKGPGYVGYMMIVLDPTRIMMGTPQYLGGNGNTTEQMCAMYNCVAGINGGAFYDPDGTGLGGQPVGLTVIDGEPKFDYGQAHEFVGFDSNYILHTGKLTAQDALDQDIQFGCSFGPVLICNGERSSADVLTSGVNPRTAIGQRSDGAVLLLVIDGRQAYSLGATYADVADVMESFGAVNACNLDGGSSTAMWWGDDYVNSTAWIIGARPVATAFLVKEAA